MRRAGLSVLIGVSSSSVVMLAIVAPGLTSPWQAVSIPLLMVAWPFALLMGPLGLLIEPSFQAWYVGFLHATHTPLPQALSAFVTWAAFFTCVAYGWRRKRSASSESSRVTPSSLRRWALALLAFSAILVVVEGFVGAAHCERDRLGHAFGLGVPVLLVAGFYWLFPSGRSGDVVTFVAALAFGATLVGLGALGALRDDTPCGPKGGEGWIVVMLASLLIQLAWMISYAGSAVVEARRSRPRGEEP